MADRAEHIAAFRRAEALLQGMATASAHALRVHCGTPIGAAAAQGLEDALDRLALLHGTARFENLSTTALFATAIQNELQLAHDSGPIPAAMHGDHLARAQALIDAARRGVRVSLRPPMHHPPGRGVYIEPLRPAFERSLRHRREPYMRWRDGIVVVLDETELTDLRAAGDTVDVLFLDADELLDLAGSGDQSTFEAELDRRLAASRAASDRIGESRERARLRALLKQSHLLRGLRNRLEGDHPAAHRATQPIVAENRALLEALLVTALADSAVIADPLAASIDHERQVRDLIAHVAAEPDDPAGLRPHFRAVAGHMTTSRR